MLNQIIRSRKYFAIALILLALTLALPQNGSVSAASLEPTPHVWVHYDYLVYPDGHSDAPDPAAIQRVVDVFAAHGIMLHIDNDHTAVASSNNYITVFPRNACALSILDVRTQYFHPTSNHEWHYALFGDRVFGGDPCGGWGVTGQAEINGDNFVIGMDFVRHFSGINALAGPFMHELGHNLGLHHGGDTDTNYKPNYLSVMNYTFNEFGIPYASKLGSTTLSGYRLDYSEGVLPPLDPAHLNETVGIQAGTSDITRFFVQRTVPPTPGGPVVLGANAPASGPIDWNLDGHATATDTAVALADPFGTLLTGKLTGFDDWAEVRGYILGTITHGPKTITTEGAAEYPVVSGISPATGPAYGGTTVTISGTHLDKATQVLFGFSQLPAKSFRIVNDKTITAISPPYPYVSGGPVDVTVVSGVNPSPSVAADIFTYPSWPVPVVQDVSPAAGPYTGGTTITIHGTGLGGATAVRFCFSTPAASFTVVDDNTIRAVTPALYGYCSVTVTTLGGTSAGGIYFIGVAKPGVLSISPTSGSTAGGTTVTIVLTLDSYSTSVGITAVSFGTSPAASFTQPVISFPNYAITAVSPPGSGSVDVTVSNAGGTSAAVAADLFSYFTPPSVTSINPTSGPAIGGTPVTIRGTDFSTATSIALGPWSGSAVLPFTIVNNSTINFVTPPNWVTAAGVGPGTYDVRVSNPGGPSATTSADLFTYLP